MAAQAPALPGAGTPSDDEDGTGPNGGMRFPSPDDDSPGGHTLPTPQVWRMTLEKAAEKQAVHLRQAGLRVYFTRPGAHEHLQQLQGTVAGMLAGKCCRRLGQALRFALELRTRQRYV